MAISRWLTTVSSMVLAAFVAGEASAQNAQKIGVASAIQNRVEGSAGNRTLAAGNSIFAREVVRTAADSSAQLLFLDETSLSIGPQSEVTLDRFVFDPSRGAGNVVVSTTRGALRFVSGSQQPSSYQIRTPVATIGVRGTIFDLYTGRDSKSQVFSVVILVEGATSIRLGGKVYDLIKSGQALIIKQDGSIQQVTWDSTLFAVVDGKKNFPLYGNHWAGLNPDWTHIPDVPRDRIEQLFGGGPPPPPDNGC